MTNEKNTSDTSHGDELMKSFFETVQMAREEGPHKVVHFAELMRILFQLANSLRPGDPVDPERLRDFRRQSAEALASFDGVPSVPHYMIETRSSAEMVGDENDWFDVCQRRSAIQSLIDDYQNTVVSSLIDQETLTDIDEEMRVVGVKLGPGEEKYIPIGIPESHWWWYYPTSSRE